MVKGLFFYFLLGVLFSPEEIKKVEDAEILFREGLYEDALKYYRDLKKTSLGKEMSLEFDFRIGECYFNMGKYLDALELFQQLETRTKNTYLLPEVYYALGVIHLAMNHEKEAEAYLVQRMKEFPGYMKDPKIMEGQGIYYFTQKIYESAYEKLTNAISGVGIFYKGEALARLERPIEALQAFQKVQILYPYTPLSEFSAFKAGDALFINKDYTGAKELFLKFIGSYGTSPLVDYAKYKTGVSFMHLNEPSTALLYLDPLLRHEDGILAAHAYLMSGICLRNLGEYEKSVKYLLKAAFDFPGVGTAPIAHMELGKTYLITGDSTQAIISFRQLSSVYNTGDFIGVGDYLTASVLYRQGRILEAQYQLETLLKYASGSYIAHPAMALLLKCLVDTRQYEEAVVSGEKYLKEKVQTLDGLEEYTEKWINRINLQIAEAHYQLKNLDKATRLYENLMESGDPGIMAEVFDGLGWCYLESKRYEAGIQKFDVVISGYQRDTSALVSSYFGKGVALYNQSSDITSPEKKKDNFVQSAYTFKQIARSFPSNELAPASLFYAGDAFSKAEYYANAIKEWEACLSEYPASEYAGYAAYWLGDTYFRAGELDKAIPYYHLLLNQYPDNKMIKDGYMGLASTYYNAKNFDETINILKKFLGLFPEDSLAEQAKNLLEQAYFFKSQEEPEKLEKYAEEFPESELLAQNLYNQAAKLYQDKKYEEALEKAKKVILLFPKSEFAPQGQKIVVACYANLENPKAMAEEAGKFVLYFPEHEEVPEMMKLQAQGLIQQEDYLKAKEVLDKLIARFPQNPVSKEAVVLRGECLLNLGKLRDAVRTLEGTPPPPDLATRQYYVLGEAYQKLGDNSKSISAYRNLLQVGGMDDSYRIRGLYALAYLYQLQGDKANAISIYNAITQVTTDANIKNDATNRAKSLQGQ